MTFKEYLISKGLSEEVVTSVIEGMPSEKFFLASEEKLDERYTKLKGQNEQLQAQLDTNLSELDTLRQNADGNEELTKQLNELQSAFESSKTDSEEKMRAQEKEFAIKLALKDSDTLDDGLILGLLNIESINVTDDGLHGLKEQLENIKSEKPFLFHVEENNPDNPNPHPQIVVPGNPNAPNLPNSDPFAAKVSKYE